MPLQSGAGTWSTISWNNGFKSLFGLFISLKSRTAQPSRPTAYRYGKSNCASSAPNLSNKSNVSVKTSSGRASARSTLLMHTIGRSPNFNALDNTNFVWGRGPSALSTNNTTPSTIDKMRSTSPPKSAWPGVSTILILYSPHWIDVGFAEMVMPRSRSMSPLSITRSSTFSLARKVPACFNILSTRVVFPWSTCAIIAMLRIFICSFLFFS